MCSAGALALAVALSSGRLPGAAASDPCAPCARGCALVTARGGEGGMDLAAVVDLNMRGWKPQSSHGIEILGWSSVRLGPERCRVSYTYRDGEEVVLAWEVDLAREAVFPLTPLAERMDRMTELLSRNVTTKASKP